MQASPMARSSRDQIKSLGRETISERNRRAARELQIQDVRESLAQEREARRSITYLPRPRSSLRYDDTPIPARYEHSYSPEPVIRTARRYHRDDNYSDTESSWQRRLLEESRRREEASRGVRKERPTGGIDQAENSNSRSNEYTVPSQQRLQRSNSDPIIGNSRPRARSFERLRPTEDEERNARRLPSRATTFDYGLASLYRDDPAPQHITISEPDLDDDEAYDSLVSLGILQPKDKRMPPYPPLTVPESSYRRAYSGRPLSPMSPALEARTRRGDAYPTSSPVNMDEPYARRDLMRERVVYVEQEPTEIMARALERRELEMRDRRMRELDMRDREMRDREMRDREVQDRGVRDREREPYPRREYAPTRREETRLVIEGPHEQPGFLRGRSHSTAAVLDRERERETPVMRSWPATCDAVYVFDINELPMSVHQALWVKSLGYNWISQRLVEKLGMKGLVAAVNIESWDVSGFRHEYDSLEAPLRIPLRLTRVQVGWRFLDIDSELKTDFFRVAPLEKLDILFGGPNLSQRTISESEELSIDVEVSEAEQQRLKYYHPVFTDILYFSKFDKQWVLDDFRRASIKRGKQPDTQVHGLTAGPSSLRRGPNVDRQSLSSCISEDDSEGKSFNEVVHSVQDLMLYHPPLTREDFIPQPPSHFSLNRSTPDSSRKSSLTDPSVMVAVLSQRRSFDNNSSTSRSGGSDSSRRTYTRGYEASGEEESDSSSRKTYSTGYEASAEKSSSTTSLGNLSYESSISIPRAVTTQSSLETLSN